MSWKRYRKVNNFFDTNKKERKAYDKESREMVNKETNVKIQIQIQLISKTLIKFYWQWTVYAGIIIKSSWKSFRKNYVKNEENT